MSASGLAAQVYTVREFIKTPGDIAATMKKIMALGYEGVQLSSLGPIDPKELRRIADDAELVICATHQISYEDMRFRPQAVIEEQRILGCQYVGMGLLPEDCSAEGCLRFAREASQVGRNLAKGGLGLVYHNHSWELERFGDRTGLEILYAESDPQVFLGEIDTYWIQHGGGDPAAWIRRLKGRLPVIHLKDMAMRGQQQIMAEVGEGNLNWPAIIEACKEAGVVWYIVEQDTCQRDPFESLGISLRNLRAMGL